LTPWALAVLLVGLVLPAQGQAQQLTDRYDSSFRKYAKRFFGVGMDWRVFKAQGLTESNLDTAALSGRGARGVMQLLPSTWQDIQSHNPEWHSIDDPEWNIAAGIFHDRRLWRQWRDSVASEDHQAFMFGSYNAGRGPIRRAQELAERRYLDPRRWASIVQVAPEVRRWRHRETVAYVERIRNTLQRLDARGRLVRGPPSAGQP
jgi:membrane-bound lytic murein transglycosylase F